MRRILGKKKWFVPTVERPRVSFFAALLSVGILLFGTGCWSRREINQLSFVMAFGLDKGRTPGQWVVSYQIAIPQALVGGGGVGGTGGGRRTIWTPATEGASLIDAVRRLSELDPRRGYFVHANLIIIGEGLAREGVAPVIDFLDRNPEIRRTALVYISHRGTAQEVIEAIPTLGTIPAAAVSGLTRWGLEAAASAPVTLEEMLSILATGKRDLALPLLYRTTGTVLSPEKVPSSSSREQAPAQEQYGNELRAAGFAVFKGTTMVGTLNRLESRGYLWLQGKIKEGIFLVAFPGSEAPVALEVRQARTRLSPVIQGNNLRFKAQIHVDYDVAEITGPADIGRREVRDALSRRLTSVIRNEIRAALRKAQGEYQADIFGFGEMIYRHYPRVWANLASRWDKVFPTVAVDLDVKTHFRDTGEVGRPLRVFVTHTLSPGR